MTTAQQRRHHERHTHLAPGNEHRRDGLSIVALWLLLVLLLGKALQPDWVLLPLDIVNQTIPPWQQPNVAAAVHNPLLEDAVFYIYPVKAWTAAQVRQGELPLWSDQLFGGYPAIYDTQAGLFYPLSLLYYWLDGATAVDLTIFLQMGLGATFMFLYLRRLRLLRSAALLGVVVFTGNGLMVVWLEWQVVHAAIIWLPLALWAVEKQVASGKWQVASGKDQPISNLQSPISSPQSPISILQSPISTGLFALAFALPWLGGHWNWALYVSLTAVLYLFWRLWPVLRRSPRRGLVAVLLPLGLGIGLSLIQVLPAFAFLRQSHRQPLTWAESQQYGLLNRFAALVMPDFFGTPLQGNWWGFDNYNETALYVGILPLLLVGAAVWPGRHGQVTRFWLAWGGLGLLWTLGTPGYGVLYWLPVFGGLLPSRAAVLVVVAAAVLAAIGLDRLLDETATSTTDAASALSAGVPGRPWWLVIAVAALLALAAVYLFWYRGEVDWTFWQRPFLTFIVLLLVSAFLLWVHWRGKLGAAWFGGLALALVALDLFAAGHDYNTLSPVSEMFPETETAVFLHNLPETPRITGLAEGIAYRPNTALADFVPSLSGYGPGISRRLVAYLRLAESGEVIRFGRVLLPLQAVNSPLLDGLGVSHIVTTQEMWGDEVAVGGETAVSDWRVLAVAQRPLTVGSAGLFRIDVPLRVASSAQGDITLRLLTPDGGQELAHHTVSAADVNGTGWTPFFFTPFPSDWGNEFLAALSFSGSGEVTVGSSAAGEWAYAAFVRSRPGLVHESGKTRVYANEGDLGRAFVVPAAQIVGSPEAALAAVQASVARQGQVVVLELEGQPAPPAIAEPAAAAGTVTITKAALNQVTLQAEMAAPGFVVLADAYDVGWRAAVDGQPTPLYRANTVVRAVYVPAGVHEIVFRYRPLPFVIGAVASGVALMGVVALGVAGMGRKRP
ncbi:MAG: YfhO family protein [Anaerolineaceae bacterium]|nr:YfhO family protein [Anaerolineaceae bacterium]